MASCLLLRAKTTCEFPRVALGLPPLLVSPGREGNRSPGLCGIRSPFATGLQRTALPLGGPSGASRLPLPLPNSEGAQMPSNRRGQVCTPARRWEHHRPWVDGGTAEGQAGSPTSPQHAPT